jgi:osmotically-inducible protein OsmY
MRTRLITIVGFAVLPAFLLSELPAQEGAAERIGKRLDRGLEELREEVKQAWTDVRKSVDKLSVQGRVYGRLRWDKALAEEPIDVSMQDKNIVVLTGRVPDDDTRQKAIQLAKDTVGVREVVDQLQVNPPQQAR